MKTFELWATRDNCTNAFVYLWERFGEPRYYGGGWCSSKSLLRGFCPQEWTRLTGIKVKRGEKKLLRFTVEEVTE